MKLRRALSCCALVLGAALSLGASAQNGPPPGGPGGPPPGGPGGPPGGPGGPGGRGGHMPSPAERAIEYRQALYTVIGGNFGPIGGILQGHGEYNAADVAKRVQRVAFLATMVGDAFPEISKDGKTKAKAEIWTDKEGFAKAVQKFVDASANLQSVVSKDHTNSAAFKDAAGKVGEACKGCHDDYRAK